MHLYGPNGWAFVFWCRNLFHRLRVVIIINTDTVLNDYRQNEHTVKWNRHVQLKENQITTQNASVMIGIATTSMTVTSTAVITEQNPHPGNHWNQLPNPHPGNHRNQLPNLHLESHQSQWENPHRMLHKLWRQQPQRRIASIRPASSHG